MAEPCRTVVFAGPSLPRRARPATGENVTWRSPAARGDLADLDLPPASRVLLIDGYLIQQHPPSPTEVFDLIERGHEVWGSSSLGALRAAELRYHGMRGHGWVFDRVVDGTITYDDELVAPLDPRTGEAAGVFLANIRFGLGELVAAGRVSPASVSDLVEGLRAVYFGQRTHDTCRGLAAAAGLDQAAVDDLMAADVKRRDALELIARATDPAWLS